MPLLTIKVLATVLQMHGPDAAIRSDNRGIDQLLGDVREELSGHAGAQAGGPPEPGDPYLIQVAKKKKGDPFGKATTIFRKGGYGKSVYGPKHRKVFD